jgi:hypothetical protein
MKRRKWKPEQKALIVLEGLKGRPIGELCAEHEITTPNMRHEASGGGNVTITSSVATGTPRAGRGRLLARLEYRGGDQHERLLRHLPLGLGLPDVAGLQRRHRAHRVLRLVLDRRDGAEVAPVRLPAPLGRDARAHG